MVAHRRKLRFICVDTFSLRTWIGSIISRRTRRSKSEADSQHSDGRFHHSTSTRTDRIQGPWRRSLVDPEVLDNCSQEKRSRRSNPLERLVTTVTSQPGSPTQVPERTDSL